MLDACRTKLAPYLALAVVLPGAAAAQQRTWADAPIEERAIHGGGADSPLLNPLLFDAGRRIAAVFDYGDYAVKAIDLETGELAWTAGRSGEGPGEFANPTDLVVGRADSVWVLDPLNRRIHVFGSDGSQGRTLRVGQDVYLRFALSQGGVFATREDVQAGLVATLSDELVHVGTLAAPSWVPELSYFASELSMNGDADGSHVVVAFKYMGRILVNAPDVVSLREIPAVAVGEEPEVITLTPRGGGVAQRISPDARPVVREVAVDGSQVYVLAYAESEDADWMSHVIDVYDVETGYSHSLKLNRPESGIAVRNGRIVVIETEMLPRITEVRANR